MVVGADREFDLSTYAGRMGYAMQRVGAKERDLANAVEVSVQAIRKKLKSGAQRITVWKLSHDR